MKRIFFQIAIMLFSMHLHAQPRVCVRVRPVHSNVVVVRPACPSPRHIWIEGEWGWNPGINNYDWREGRWVLPQPYAKWIPGHWKQTYEGYYWMQGHWKRVR